MINNTFRSLAVILMLLLPRLIFAQDNKAFEKGSFSSKGYTLPYRILFPDHFDPQKKYPLILVLHGAGERGDDNEAQLKYGTKLFLNDTIRSKYAAIIIFPQCPAADFWSNVKMQDDSVTKKLKWVFTHDMPPTKAMQALMGMVDEFLDKPYVDKHKMYVGGLSMGGMGTLEIIGRMPGVFAAAFSCCGGDNTLNAKKYAKKVPLWIFHGQKDSVVPYTHSESIVAAIKEAGGKPRYTLYPNDDHNCWNNAFAEPDLIPWLFAHNR